MKRKDIEQGYERIDPNSVEGFNEQREEYEYNEETNEFEAKECPESGGFLQRNDYYNRN